MTDLELHLLNDFQRDFPLVPAPFGVMAGRLGASEADVLETLTQLQARGTVSRVGAVFRPHSIGASTLAALAVPADELDEVAQMVSGYAEVNHNYEREHHYNLWFVVAAADEARVREVLGEIEQRPAARSLHLPLLEDYHIDLGFDLVAAASGQAQRYRRGAGRRRALRCTVQLPQPAETALIAAIQQGLPLVPRPYAEIGAGIGLSESEVIAGLHNLAGAGRHQALGRGGAPPRARLPRQRHGGVGHSRRGGERAGALPRQASILSRCATGARARLPAWRYNLFYHDSRPGPRRSAERGSSN